MKKYKVFRSFGDIERSVKKHVLVAVEYGKDIYDVTDNLVRAVNDDATGLEKYQHGYTSSTLAPEFVQPCRNSRYAYTMTAFLHHEFGKRTQRNDVIEYGITEEDGEE